MLKYKDMKMWVTKLFSHVIYPDIVQLWAVLAGTESGMQSLPKSYLLDCM